MKKQLFCVVMPGCLIAPNALGLDAAGQPATPQRKVAR